MGPSLSKAREGGGGPDRVEATDPAPDLRLDDAAAAIAGAYTAARRALSLVRAYRREPGTSGRREREAIEEVRRLRSLVRRTRAERWEALDAGPGVRKADGTEAAVDPARAGGGR